MKANLCDYHIMEEKYKDKKVEIKKMDGHNPVYGYFRQIVSNTHVLVEKGLIKPTNGSGLSQELYEKLSEVDVFDAIDKFGYRTLFINIDDIRSLEEVLSRAERENKLHEILGHPEDSRD